MVYTQWRLHFYRYNASLHVLHSASKVDARPSCLTSSTTLQTSWHCALCCETFLMFCARFAKFRIRQPVVFSPAGTFSLFGSPLFKAAVEAAAFRLVFPALRIWSWLMGSVTLYLVRGHSWSDRTNYGCHLWSPFATNGPPHNTA